MESLYANETDSQYQTLGRSNDAAYLTRAQRTRLERIRQARLLTDRQYDYFIGESRTKFGTVKFRINDGPMIDYYEPLNLLDLIAKKSGDLLYGSDPVIRVSDDNQEASLKQLISRSNLTSIMLESEFDCASTGESILEICRHESKVFVTVHAPEEFHPEGKLQPDRQHPSYVYYAEENIGTDAAPDWKLLEQRYKPGSIERAVWQLNDRKEKGQKLELNAWPAFATETPAEVEPTGVAQNLIVWIPNRLQNGRVISDFDGLIGLQDKVNFKSSQLDAVLAKHGRPKLAAHVDSADEDGNLKASGDVFYFRTKEEIPQYIVWNAEIGSAIQERDNAIDHVCVVAEMSPELLGIKRGIAAPESAKALKIRVMNSLAKAARKATVRAPLIARALKIAQDLEQATPGNGMVSFVPAEPSVRVKDGLPIDELELATIVSTYRSSNSMSLEDAVAARIPDPEAAAVEVDRIKAERAEATPSILFGESGASSQQNNAGEPAQAAVEAA